MNQPIITLSFSAPSLSLGKFLIPRLPAVLQPHNVAQFSPLHRNFPLLFSINHRKPTLQIVAAAAASSSPTMDSSDSTEIAHDHSPFLKIYKDGRIERIAGIEIVPPSLDSKTGVESKDVVISPETGVSARLYIPKTTKESQKKLPLLVYFHGGGFCVETAFSSQYHNYLNSFVAEANVVAVSVEYRRAPEQPVPIAYDDSWAALKWVASHTDGKGPDEWLKNHADFESVFFAGDSAGANIAHHMGLRVGLEGLAGVKLDGIVLVHPYFWGKEPIGGEDTDAEKRGKVEALWRFTCPATSGADDPYINPGTDPKLGSLGCKRVLICIAEKDMLKDRGWYYSELLGKSGYRGVVEVMEAKGEDHVFHLMNSTCENSVALLKRIVSFINQGQA